jgi:lysophospholipase L1-like esterase
MTLHRLLVLCLCFCWPCLGQPAKRIWTILPLGDSITAGSTDFQCYREPLSRRLAAAGAQVRFVGSRHNAREPEELRHEGYGGKTVEFLAENVERLFQANPADIVLLHAGHNHFVEEQPIPGILAATEKIIATARRINPRVTFLLAQVITSGKLPKYSYIPELNRELAGLAARLNTAEQQVILVDQATGFDYRTDTVSDMVHPNSAGAEKMAAKWERALLPLLAQRP